VGAIIGEWTLPDIDCRSPLVACKRETVVAEEPAAIPGDMPELAPAAL
jgi:hypothetical protein